MKGEKNSFDLNFLYAAQPVVTNAGVFLKTHILKYEPLNANRVNGNIKTKRGKILYLEERASG